MDVKRVDRVCFVLFFFKMDEDIWGENDEKETVVKIKENERKRLEMIELWKGRGKNEAHFW